MSYTGPSSVVPLVDAYLLHWLGLNATFPPPSFFSVVLEGTTVAKVRNDLVTLRNMYNAVQSAPGTGAVLPPTLPQYPSIQTLRNNEENAREAGSRSRELVTELIGAFNRKVRGALAHTTFPNSLPDKPSNNDGMGRIIAAADDLVQIWTSVNGLAAGPLFTPPLTVAVTVAGSATPVPLPLADGLVRVNGLKTAAGDIAAAENGLAAMRAHRDKIWEQEIRPLLLAYAAKVRGDFPEGNAFVVSLPRIYPAPGSTPDPVSATGAWNAATSEADYTWSASTDPDLERYVVRQSPGATYDADAATTLGSVLPGEALAFSTNAGLGSTGDVSSVKIYVVLTTGNERGSNTVTVVRP